MLPSGMAPWVLGWPGLIRLRRRSSSGSIFSSAAASLTIISMAAMVCRDPYPRMEPQSGFSEGRATAVMSFLGR
ncbi:hypothetical protein D3C85_1588690 [compost metagenome]